MKHQHQIKQAFEKTPVDRRLMEGANPNQVRVIKDHTIQSRNRARVRTCTKPLARECRRVTVQPANKPNSVDWDMVAIWAVVAVSFAALAFVGFVIWAKLNTGIY